MDDVVMGLAYALPAIPVWVAHVWHRSERRKRHRAVFNEARDAGLVEPPSLHPVIDLGACIGCGACVDACPEGDVLGLITDKATLIDPTRCIGHGACKAACPADAISLVFGTATRGFDIPTVDPNFESSVPGIYIAGELGGMGLIRNAIEQGRQAMEAIIASTLDETSERDMFDVVIVGAGPAGISASLVARQAGLRCLAIEQNSLGGTVAHYPRGKIVMTAPVTLPGYGRLDFREISKEELIGLWTRVVRESGVDITYEQRVENISRLDVGFEIKTEVQTIRARRVLLAIGRRGTPRTLDVPGESSSKVTYQLIEPEQYGGCAVLVVGGGDSAVEAALTLAEQRDTQVVLAHRGAVFDRARRKNRARLDAMIADGAIRCHTRAKVLEIAAGEVLIASDAGEERISNDHVIVCAGGVLPTTFLQSIGISMERKFGQA